MADVDLLALPDNGPPDGTEAVVVVTQAGALATIPAVTGFQFGSFTPGTRPAASTMPFLPILVYDATTNTWTPQVSNGTDWVLFGTTGTAASPEVDASLTLSVDGPYLAPTS